MKFTFLGTGTSSGVPVLGCQCEVCRSSDPRDRRFRCVGLLETDTTRLLIDCGPDIRMQLMPLPFRKIDGVLLTHIHYDHVAGMDDLRGFCVFGDINVYANPSTAAALRVTMPYCFTEKLYPGVPRLNLHTVEPGEKQKIGDIEWQAIEVMHGKMPILAYRFGDFAYITDMKSISDESRAHFAGVKTLVVNALRFEREHHSHMFVDDAIEFARSVGAERTFLIHLTHNIGFHDDANRRLPDDVRFAYDGLTIEV